MRPSCSRTISRLMNSPSPSPARLLSIESGSWYVGGGDDGVLIESVFLLPQLLLGVPVLHGVVGNRGSAAGLSAPAERACGYRSDDSCFAEARCRSALHGIDNSSSPAFLQRG